MTNPNCLVCRGAGTVRDTYAGRDEPCACRDLPAPERDAYAPSIAGWASEALAEVMRKAEQRQSEQDAHAATCNDRPCKRCERFVCACGKPFDGQNNHRCRDCWLAEKRERSIEPARASVPKRFRWAFDADAEKLRGRVKANSDLITRALANPPGTDFVLLGDTAAGKTSLIVAMFDAWLRADPERRAGARFVEAYRLAGARARYPLGQGEPPEVTEAMEAPLLVIDDLGSDTDDRRDVLKEVILRRHDDELPTWITTGFGAEQLMGRYGSQIFRRIFEQAKRVALGKS